MPHLIIEHSSIIPKKNITDLTKQILEISLKHEGNYDLNQFKSRSISFDEYSVGNLNQSQSAFIHITLKALSGRSLEIKKSLSDKILNCAKDFFMNLNIKNLRCDISVDMVDMERDSYSKISLQ